MTTKVLEVYAKEDASDMNYPISISRNLSIIELEAIIAQLKQEVNFMAMPHVKEVK